MEPARHAGRAPVVAAVAAIALALLVTYVGARYQTSGAAFLTSAWDFRVVSTPSWRVLGGQGLGTDHGLTVVPAEEKAPAVGSERTALDPQDYTDIRIRLSTQHSSSGKLWLVVESAGERRGVPYPFRVRGGGVEEEIVVPLGSDWAQRTTILGLGMVPSDELQPVTIASIAFDRVSWSPAAVFRELGSPWPGEAASKETFAINALPPPLMGGRSAWAVVVPVVLLAGTAAALIGPIRLGALATVRRGAWIIVGVAWAIGLSLTLYHQLVAWRLDVSRFSGLSRAQAYAVIDGVPLWDDMAQVARVIPPRTNLDVVVDVSDPEKQGLWLHRAAYYLYPIVVQSPAPRQLRYFGGAHEPCGRVEPDATVLLDAERYCLFGEAG
jgi:hypothetical protein